jgi:hypothetical protein
MNEQVRVECHPRRRRPVRRDLIERQDVQPGDEYASSAGNSGVFQGFGAKGAGGDLKPQMFNLSGGVRAAFVHGAKEARESALSKGRVARSRILVAHGRRAVVQGGYVSAYV